MIKDKSYVHGTAAEKLGYDVYEENKVLKEKKNQRNNNKAKLNVVRAVFLVFCFGCLVMFRYAQITETNYSIEKKIIEYNEARNENIRVKVQIEEDLSNSKIEESAVKVLGMHKPDKYQLTYVEVPRNDFTIVSEEAKQEQRDNSSMPRKLFASIDRFVKLLY